MWIMWIMWEIDDMGNDGGLGWGIGLEARWDGGLGSCGWGFANDG